MDRGGPFQQELLIGPWESFLDALRDDVKALGGSTSVGAWFNPEKSQQAQRNYVNDRLSDERRERFSDEQLELLMRRAIQRRGYSAAHWYRCDVLGTERPRPKNPETEKERAMAAFVQAAATVKGAVEELKRLGHVVGVKLD
jgi:hypothetical protein